jgi:CRISPR-associated protein Csb1
MTIDYDKLKNAPRLLLEAELKPRMGHRFQPTGFADLGPARYTLPDGTEMLLIESVQSVANWMESTCWDHSSDDLLEELKGLPYIRVDCGPLGKTNSINEFHRLNSPYIWSGDETVKTKAFRARFLADVGLSPNIVRKKSKQSDSGDGDPVPGILDLRKFYSAVFKYDPNAVIHGLFLEKVAGRLRMPRLLSGFIEASNVRPVESGGAKVDQVLPSPGALGLNANEGYGNVPFPRTEFVGDIKAYFNLDLALLRGFGLSTDEEKKQLAEWKAKKKQSPGERPFVFSTPEKLLIALSLFKIREFLSTRLRLRTACDLELRGDLTVTKPDGGFALPNRDALLSECTKLIEECKPLFADPPITEVEWKRKERPVEVKLPEGTQEQPIPEELKEEIEWKKGSTRKPPALKFKKALTPKIVEEAKTLFAGNEGVAKALDEALAAQQSSGSDGEEGSSNSDDGSSDV